MIEGYPMMGMGPMGTMGPLIGEMSLGPHMGHTHSYGPIGMGMITHESTIMGAPMMGPEQIMSEATSQIISGALPSATTQGAKEIIHCKSCTLFPPNPNAPPPTTRERPPGCRTIFVGGKHISFYTIKNFCYFCFKNFLSSIVLFVFPLHCSLALPLIFYSLYYSSSLTIINQFSRLEQNK